MPHRHSVLRSNMSRNQSRTMGSTWIFRRFAVLQLGSSATSAAAGVAGAAQGVLTWAISSCVSGRAMVQSMFPELLPAGVSGGPLPFDWWPTQTNRQGDVGPSSSEEDAEKEAR